MSENNTEEVGSILESNFLNWVGAIGIFLIVGVALFNFTQKGKTFSILTYLIALFLIVVLLVDYYTERNKQIKKGNDVRVALDLLSFGIIATGLLVAWIIYEAWNTSSETGFRFPLSFIAGEIAVVAERVAEEIVRHPKLLMEVQNR